MPTTCPYDIHFEKPPVCPPPSPAAQHPLAGARKWSELRDARWALNLPSAGSQGNQSRRPDGAAARPGSAAQWINLLRIPVSDGAS
jgi:hypothetical protein